MEDGTEKISLGRVLSVTPPTRIEIEWQDTDWKRAMIFSFTLFPAEDGTRVVLEEEGWEQFPVPRRSELMEAHLKGWNAHLENLKRTVEPDAPIGSDRDERP